MEYRRTIGGMEPGKLTVGELRAWLANYRDEEEVHFGAGLTFYRVKDRGGIANIEFNEVVVEMHRPDFSSDPISVTRI